MINGFKVVKYKVENVCDYLKMRKDSVIRDKAKGKTRIATFHCVEI